MQIQRNWDAVQRRLSDGYDSGVQTLVGGNVQIHTASGGPASAAAHATAKVHKTASVHKSTTLDKTVDKMPAAEPAAKPTSDESSKGHAGDKSSSKGKGSAKK